MYRISRWLAVAAALTGIGASAAMAAAAPEPPAAVTIGVIEMKRVGQEAQPFKDSTEQLRTLQEKLDRNFVDVVSTVFHDAQPLLDGTDSPYLTLTETNEYVVFVNSTTPLDPAQTKRSGELKKLAEDRHKDWLDLAQVMAPTAEQKARIDELAKITAAKQPVLAVLTKLHRDYQIELDKKQEEVLTPLLTRVGTLIGDVAKDKKLSVVLTKRVTTATGDEEVVLWGGADITDEVISRLNKKPK